MLDLEEQEQVDALKAWWKKNGNTVLLGVALFAAAVGGVKAWNYYQFKNKLEASVIFQVLQQEVERHGDLKKIRAVAGEVMDKYPGTPYAAAAALTAAKMNYEAGDAKSAKAQLQWVMDHAREDQTKDMARLRLAGILLDEKNYAEALRLLEAKHDPAFSGLYEDLKGDVLQFQGKLAEARSAYKSALDKTDQKSAYRNYIQIKLDAMGGEG